jgi:hypothetical protein
MYITYLGVKSETIKLFKENTEGKNCNLVFVLRCDTNA